jgi:hypothetical protein
MVTQRRFASSGDQHPPVELYEVQLDGLFPATVQLQAVPLSVNAVGTELVPLQFAVKPTAL